MNFDDIMNILRTHNEGTELEFITSLDKDKQKFGATLAAFATEKGGHIYLGVTDNKEPVGINYSVNLKDKITSISRDCKESVFVQMEPVKFNGDHILVIYVSKGSNPPYMYKGVPYRRIDATNQPLNPDEVTNIRLISKNLSFDRLPCRNIDRVATLVDIDQNKINRFAELAAESRKMIISKDPYTCLTNLDLLCDGIQPKNAGIIMFGKEPQKFIPQNKINLYRFVGNSVSKEFIDKQEIEGDLLYLINSTISFIQRNTRRTSIIEDFTRIDITEYPYEALREGIINAIMHRDYLISESEISVRIFDDRIEIINPGGLCGGLTIPKIEKGGISIRRNPILADLIHMTGFIDKAGTGVPRMRELMVKRGLPKPILDNEDNWFSITFNGPGEKLMDIARKFSTKKDLSHLNKRQYDALQHIYKTTGINRLEYQKRYKVSSFTAYKDLLLLLQEGLVIVKGKGRSTRYFKPRY